MLRPGPGNLNDLFKVAAKERSNLKKQSSNAEANQSKARFTVKCYKYVEQD
jgi:hypothetical protein